MTGDEKINCLRAAVSLLREHTVAPEIFNAIEGLAEADGAFIATTVTPILLRSPLTQSDEDQAVSVMAQFIEERQATIRRDGVADAEVAAYAALVSIQATDRLSAIGACLQEAEGAVRH